MIVPELPDFVKERKNLVLYCNHIFKAIVCQYDLGLRINHSQNSGREQTINILLVRKNQKIVAHYDF
jgi:hypothetical protein